MVNIYPQILGTSNLKKISWDLIKNMNSNKINIFDFELYSKDLKNILPEKNNVSSILIFDCNTNEQIEQIIQEISSILKNEYTIIILMPLADIVPLQKLSLKENNIYTFQKPIRPLELFFHIRLLCLLHLKSDMVNQKKEQNLNSSELEKIIPFIEYSNQELISKEDQTRALQNLLDYTLSLLQEERSISEALINFNNYKDTESRALYKDINSRELLMEYLYTELKEKDGIIQSLENLLEYSRLLKISFEDMVLSCKNNPNITVEDMIEKLQDKNALIEKVQIKKDS